LKCKATLLFLEVVDVLGLEEDDDVEVLVNGEESSMKKFPCPIGSKVAKEVARAL